VIWGVQVGTISPGRAVSSQRSSGVVAALYLNQTQTRRIVVLVDPGHGAKIQERLALEVARKECDPADRETGGGAFGRTGCASGDDARQ